MRKEGDPALFIALLAIRCFQMATLNRQSRRCTSNIFQIAENLLRTLKIARMGCRSTDQRLFRRMVGESDVDRPLSRFTSGMHLIYIVDRRCLWSKSFRAFLQF